MNEKGGCKSVGSERAREKKRKGRFVLSTLKTFFFSFERLQIAYGRGKSANTYCKGRGSSSMMVW